MKLVLTENFPLEWSDTDPFDAVQEINGKIYREKEGRKTLRFEEKGKAYFLKYHNGVGWKEIAKNLVQLKMPVTGASNEWKAINLLEKKGISTLMPVAFGERGLNPARKKSFLITKELIDTLSLAKFVDRWEEENPAFNLKKSIIEKLAEVAREIHEAGLNHRDLYLCHFLLDISGGVKNVSPDKIKFYLVDLHRAQIRNKVPLRWQVKDVASIYFSSMDLKLTKRDIFRFMMIYSGKPLAKTLREDRGFWLKVQKRANKLYRRDWSKEPPVFFNV